MSNEEDVDERQYRYVRKYYKMVKQFDELIEIMDARTTQLKRRRVSSSPRKSRSSTGAAAAGNHSSPPPAAGGSTSRAAARGRSNSKSTAATSQLDNNVLVVQTIARHLQDLKDDNPASDDN